MQQGAAGVGVAGEDGALVGLVVELADGAQVRCLQQRDPTGRGRCVGGVQGLVDHDVQVPVGDGAVRLVGVEGAGLAVTQLEAGAGLPGVREAVQGGQFGGGAAAGEHPERPAGPDRAALQVVADQDDPGVGLLGELDQGGQGAGLGQGGRCRATTPPTG